MAYQPKTKFGAFVFNVVRWFVTNEAAVDAGIALASKGAAKLAEKKPDSEKVRNLAKAAAKVNAFAAGFSLSKKF